MRHGACKERSDAIPRSGRARSMAHAGDLQYGGEVVSPDGGMMKAEQGITIFEVRRKKIKKIFVFQIFLFTL